MSKCEPKKLSPKRDIFETESSHWAIIESFKSHNPDKSIFRDIWECKSQCERQLGKQEGYFRRFIVNHEHMHIFSQHVLFTQEFYNRQKIFECKKCRKNLSYHVFFNPHKRTHSKEEPSECKECAETVATLYFRKQQGIQGNNKCSECKECWKAFLHCSRLKQHLRIHNGEECYECKECGKAFRNSSCLRVHIRTHTGEKPYKCIQCGKAFSTSTNLIMHKRIHTG